QHAQGPDGDVLEIADWRGDEIERTHRISVSKLVVVSRIGAVRYTGLCLYEHGAALGMESRWRQGRAAHNHSTASIARRRSRAASWSGRTTFATRSATRSRLV